MIPLIPQDKANHFAYGAVLCALGVLAAQALGFPPLWGGILPVIVGALKEGHDAWVNYRTTGDWRTGPHGVQGLDFLWTVAGGLPILAVVL